MQFVAQTLEEILQSLQPLAVSWEDDVAREVISRIRALPRKKRYDEGDIKLMLEGGRDRKALTKRDFDLGLLTVRLFLGLSDDQFDTTLREATGGAGSGVKRYKKDPDGFVAALEDLGLIEAITLETNRTAHWTDRIVERLRSGRGSAITGQQRGKGLETFAETIVRRVFGAAFDVRCSFVAPRGRAKCDIAIPSKATPCILIESKGYGATGSKQSDVLGDIEKIIGVKRPDTAFLIVTDGVTWRRRQNDLRAIIRHQNEGTVTRIYTTAMAERFEGDLTQLKGEYGL